VNYAKRATPKKKETIPELMTPHSQYILDILLVCSSGSSLPPKGKERQTTTLPPGVYPCPPGQDGEPIVVHVLLDAVEEISHLRLHLPKDLRPLSQREVVGRSIAEVKRRFPKGVPLLDPVENMGIKDMKFKELIGKIAVLEERLFANPMHTDSRLPQLFQLYEQKHLLGERIRGLKKKFQESNDVMQLEELKSRKRVLRRLGFTTSADIVDMKGRVACEISTGDELLLTEMIFNGVFNDLVPEHCAAVLSCFVFDEKSEKATKLSEALATPLRSLQEIARRIAGVCKESKLPIVEDEYVQSFKVELMDPVVQWCRGASFSELCKLTDVFEGSLIRVFRRLQELIRQMTAAAKVIGNNELEEKFKKSSEMLERPNSVIFCSSLYL